MRFAQNQHKIGYGDESWATDSMMRNQSMQQQYHPGNLSFRSHENLVRVGLSSERIRRRTSKMIWASSSGDLEHTIWSIR